MDNDIPLAHRDYYWALACEKIHDFAPDQTSKQYKQDSFNFITNFLAPMYKGELAAEQVLSTGDKPFVQSPTMLNYWAKSKGFKPVNLNEREPNNNEFVLAYYPPFARTYLENSSEDLYDNNNKHFYSHCKSEYICEDGMKIVSNPELTYNSNSHCGNGKNANIYNPRTEDKVDKNVKGYLPEDAITYVIDYTKLGLNKKDVENGFKFVSADINVLDPNIQNAIFTLQDNGYTADEIVNLYVSNIDITNKKNIDKLAKDKNCDISKLATKNNKYRYNLQEYNCAVKPVSALVFANECKIHNNKELNAEKCRLDLGLPNIYDPQNYDSINKVFYKKYMDTLEKESDKENSMSFKHAISMGGWGFLEGADIALENMQNYVQKIFNIENNAKNRQQSFDNKVALKELKKQIQKEEKVTPQNEDTPKNTYTMLDKNISYNINNQNNR